MTMPYSSAISLVRRIRIEAARARVHGRPEIIRVQPQQQFKDFGIGLRTDVAGLRLEVLRGPRTQAPVLVIQKNAAIFHGRRALLEKVAVQRETIFPSFTGTSAHQYQGETPIISDKLVDAENRPAPVAARDDQRAFHPGQRIFHDLQNITFPLRR